MKKVIIVLFTILAFVFNSVSQEQTNLRNELVSRLVGEWINLDSNTGNVTKVIITIEDEELFINAFGDCQPEDCEWGKVKIHEITASIEDEYNVIPFDYLIALWEIEGKTKNAITEIMKITIETGPKPKLHVETIGIFNDDSGRRNIHHLDLMEKKN